MTDAQKLAANVSSTGDSANRDAQRVLEFATGVKSSLVDDSILPKDSIKGSVYTVHFVDTKSVNNTISVQTGEDGKINKDNVPTLPNYVDDKNITYRLCGWSTKDNGTVTDVINNWEELVLDKDTNLYAVWTPLADAKIIFHYDGEKMNSEEGEEVEKTFTFNDCLAGDTIDFGNIGIEEAKYESTNNGVTYTQSGWHSKNSTSNALLTETYTIPAAKNNKPLTIHLYPAWDITATAFGDITDTEINAVMTELKSLQTPDGKNCGNINIGCETKITNTVTIDSGITITFSDKVTVGENGKIDNNGNPEAVHKTESATITKEIGNVATDFQDSLNNSFYDVVKLNSTSRNIVTCNTNVTVQAGSNAVLDLNNQKLNFGARGVLKIASEDKENNKAEGNLTIINSGNSEGTITNRKSIENAGNLTIGENVTEDTSENKVKITCTNTSTESVIKNVAGATTTVKSGEIIGASTTIPVGFAGVVTNEKDGTVIIEGGKVDASTTEGRIPALLNEGTAKISGGELSRSNNNALLSQGYYVVVNHGEMEISNGTFQEYTDSPTNLSGTAALIENGYNNHKDAINIEPQLTISGGTFNGGRYVIASDFGGITKVTGGMFKANGMTSDSDVTNKTRSIFRAVGEMEIDLSNATAESTKIDLGTKFTNLVIVGDNNLTEDESKELKTHKASLKMHPIDPSLVTIGKKAFKNYDEIATKIVVDKTKDTSSVTKSDIIVYVGNDDKVKAGEQLMSVIKNSVAKDMQGESAEKNKVTIVLGSDVEIISNLDTKTNYKPTKDNTVLDLNGHTLTIHRLAVFKKNVTIKDDTKNGKIILDSDLTTNGPITIYENGGFVEGVDLSALANQEVDK